MTKQKSSASRRLLPLCALLLTASALDAPALWAAPAPASAQASASYRLGVGDNLQISVTNHPDVNTEVVVRPDGKISVPRVGELTARGKTALALGREIERVLARTLNNARVQVIVTAAAPRQASISGAVKTPAPYAVKPGTRVLDLIALAGGLSARPNRITARVIRNGQTLGFNLPGAINNPGGKDNLPIQPDDTVILDEANFAGQLSVAGNVATPGPFDLDENLTVAQLFAQAGGPTQGAALKSAYVLREGKPIPLDLSGLQDGTLDADSPLNRFRFAPGDVLFVPENKNRVGIMGAVANPSFYPLPEDRKEATVTRVLSLSGGATEFGDLSNVTLTRANGQNLIIDVAAMMEGLAPDNVRLRPDDVLFVPKKRISNVSVIGPVSTPGSFPLTENMTLISLLAQAGNPGEGAGLRKAYVLRDGRQIPVDLRALLVEGQNNPELAGFRMENGDVLVIPDNTEQVTISGQIAKPGAYSLSDDMTVVSLLAKAGNELSGAALSQAYVLRQGIRIPLDLNVFLSGTKDKPWLTNFRLAPGDTLYIPENKIVYAVWGQVASPGTFAYPDSPAEATVLRALGKAGGPTSVGAEGGANLKDARIIRVVGGQVSAIPVNLNTLFSDKKDATVQNLVLQPGDALYIPSKKRGFRLTDVLGPALALRSLGGF